VHKGSLVHVSPACARSDHFGSYVCSLSLHFCKRFFPRESMTSWSQSNSFTAAPGLPLYCTVHAGLKISVKFFWCIMLSIFLVMFYFVFVLTYIGHNYNCVFITCCCLQLVFHAQLKLLVCLKENGQQLECISDLVLRTAVQLVCILKDW
jgi:Flp pilus assembly protein TadB